MSAIIAGFLDDLYANNNRFVLTLRTESYFTAFWCVLAGVLEQVGKDLRESHRVAFDEERLTGSSSVNCCCRSLTRPLVASTAR